MPVGLLLCGELKNISLDHKLVSYEHTTGSYYLTISTSITDQLHHMTGRMSSFKMLAYC